MSQKDATAAEAIAEAMAAKEKKKPLFPDPFKFTNLDAVILPELKAGDFLTDAEQKAETKSSDLFWKTFKACKKAHSITYLTMAAWLTTHQEAMKKMLTNIMAGNFDPLLSEEKENGIIMEYFTALQNLWQEWDTDDFIKLEPGLRNACLQKNAVGLIVSLNTLKRKILKKMHNTASIMKITAPVFYTWQQKHEQLKDSNILQVHCCMMKTILLSLEKLTQRCHKLFTSHEVYYEKFVADVHILKRKMKKQDNDSLGLKRPLLEKEGKSDDDDDDPSDSGATSCLEKFKRELAYKYLSFSKTEVREVAQNMKRKLPNFQQPMYGSYLAAVLASSCLKAAADLMASDDEIALGGFAPTALDANKLSREIIQTIEEVRQELLREKEEAEEKKPKKKASRASQTSAESSKAPKTFQPKLKANDLHQDLLAGLLEFSDHPPGQEPVVYNLVTGEFDDDDEEDEDHDEKEESSGRDQGGAKAPADIGREEETMTSSAAADRKLLSKLNNGVVGKTFEKVLGSQKPRSGGVRVACYGTRRKDLTPEVRSIIERIVHDEYGLLPENKKKEEEEEEKVDVDKANAEAKQEANANKAPDLSS